MAIFLVLLFREISLWPELLSPPRCRIQGRYPERHGEEGRKQILVSNILYSKMSVCAFVCIYDCGPASQFVDLGEVGSRWTRRISSTRWTSLTREGKLIGEGFQKKWTGGSLYKTLPFEKCTSCIFFTEKIFSYILIAWKK